MLNKRELHLRAKYVLNIHSTATSATACGMLFKPLFTISIVNILLLVVREHLISYQPTSRIELIQTNIRIKQTLPQASGPIKEKNSEPTIVNLRKFLISLLISLILVGMILQRQLPIRSLDLFIGGTFRNLQNIIIALSAIFQNQLIQSRITQPNSSKKIKNNNLYYLTLQWRWWRTINRTTGRAESLFLDSPWSLGSRESERASLSMHKSKGSWSDLGFA